jgi:TonB-dependent receptor
VAEPLSGALVRVQGTPLFATTDVAGIYRLDRVPSGSQTLAVSYLGSETATVQVQVEVGQVVELTIELEPEPTYYETVTVVAEPFLEGQASALNQQKTAINIKNIISSDQIGRFPDPNSAEATQRVSGVTVQRDQGEGRYVLVRGTDPRLSSAAINGDVVPAPEGDIRYVALDVVPADLLEAIEVTKAITPDMDGDTIGGAVNLVTKQAPAGTRMAWTAGLGYNDISGGGLQTGNATYATRSGDGRSGFVLSGSFLNTDRGSENFEPAYDDGDLDTLEIRDYTVNRKRWGINGSYDFQASPNSSYFVRGIFNKFDDQEYRRATVEGVADERIERELKDRFEEQIISSISGGTTQQLGGDMRLDLMASFGYAEENEPDALYSVYRQDDVVFNPNVSADSIDPDNIQANPVNEDINEFALDEMSLDSNKTTDRHVVVAADLSQPFGGVGGNPGRWQFGTKLRFQDKDRDNNTTVGEPEDDVFLSNVADPDFDGGGIIDGRYVVGPHVNPDFSRSLFPTLPGEKNLEEDLADYEAKENTFAGYGMVELDFSERTHFLTGLRYEYVDVDYTSRELVFDEEGDLVSVAPVEGTNSYSQLLPMVHLRYELTPDANLRAAFTRSFSRPNFSDVVPFQLILEEDREIERGNPDLKPTTSWNLDLLGEKYFTTVGIVSGGIFYKSMEDQIFTTRVVEDIDGEIFEITQPDNLPSADILGFEGAFQNALRFLPSPLDGVGIYANYTYTTSSADLPGRENTDNSLPGQAENVGNFAVAYEKYGFSGRITWNYHSEYLFEVGDGPETDTFIDSHLQLDLSLSQHLGGGFRVFAEIINLTDEPYRVYEGTPDRPIQEEYYSWWGTFGVKWDF